MDALASAIGPEEAFAGELAHRSEHSIELAGLAAPRPGGRAVRIAAHPVRPLRPFVRGGAEPGSDPMLAALIDGLRQALAGRRALVLAAADLAHVGPAFGGRPLDLMGRARLQAADDELVERMCAGDGQGLFAAIRREGDRRTCAGCPPSTWRCGPPRSRGSGWPTRAARPTRRARRWYRCAGSYWGKVCKCASLQVCEEVLCFEGTNHSIIGGWSAASPWLCCSA